MIQLRDYQTKMLYDIQGSQSAGNRNVLAVLPTGGGKTVIMSKNAQDTHGPACGLAHRQELVGQISIAMARMNITHNLIASKNVVKFCVAQQVKELGTSFYHHNAPFAVGGVDTLLRRADDLIQWRNQVAQWTIDEAHHVLYDNKWGKAVTLFPNARGLGFTATPVRCDRKSLHRSQGGVFDDMVVGPSMRELIDQGYLSDYRIYGPPQSMDVSRLDISKTTGDYTAPSIRKEVERSTITGDIVQHYMRIAPGKRGIVFVVDVEHSQKVAQAFRDVGIRAESVSAKTPDSVRVALIEKFGRGDIDILVNVDLFGEGFDVPAVEVVIMARPTQSYGLYVQQFGRVLRILEGKQFGVVIDHVGNVIRHGLPDAKRVWSLLSEERGTRSKVDPDVMPTTTCVECFRAYEVLSASCPYCGHKAEPESRSQPKFVDGDLIEFSPELLASLRGEIAKIDDAPTIPFSATPEIAGAIVRRHKEKQQAQEHLREAIALWAGIRRDVMFMDDSEIYRRFHRKFGIDVMSAQALKSKDAGILTTKIREDY